MNSLYKNLGDLLSGKLEAFLIEVSYWFLWRKVIVVKMVDVFCRWT